MNQQAESILKEIRKVITGKDDVTERILRTFLAGGHILLDDVPGVGKTSLALALSHAIDLSFHRLQFTPDVMPSDVVGFSVYDREEKRLIYQPGAVCNANLMLVDEINRASSRTQSALLEAMEEQQVTVDGQTHPLETPFCVIATQNNVGSAGTQLLPYAQTDRFMVRLTIGQPDHNALVDLLRDRQNQNPMTQVQCVASTADLLHMQEEVRQIHAGDPILDYIARLTLATHEHPTVETGVSPRGALFLDRSAKAHAWMQGRDFVTGEDVQAVFRDVCAHRLILTRKAMTDHLTATGVLQELLRNTTVPDRKA